MGTQEIRNSQVTVISVLVTLACYKFAGYDWKQTGTIESVLRKI